MSSPRPLLVFTTHTGQMTHRLFRLASLIQLSRYRSIPILFSGFTDFAPLWTGTYQKIIPCYPDQSALEKCPGFAPLMEILERSLCSSLSQHKPTGFEEMLRQIQDRGIEGLALQYAPTARLGIERILSSLFDFIHGSSLHDPLCKTILASEQNPFDLFTSDLESIAEGCQVLLMKGDSFCIRPTAVPPEREAILEYFSPLSEFEDQAIELVRTIRKPEKVLCGVHIRQGDYKAWQGGRYFYEVSKYCDLMLAIERLLGRENVQFLVSSNEALSREDFSNACDVSFTSGDVVIDLLALSHCNYLLGPPSGFSRWAAIKGQIPLYLMETEYADLTMSDFTVPNF